MSIADEWILKLCHIYAVDNYSAVGGRMKSAIGSNMRGSRDDSRAAVTETPKDQHG